MRNLRILEANEVGHGILIEMDAGWLSPKDKLNEQILREAANMDYKNPFEFYAVLQKYDTPNRNGRFYPEKILRREADNGTQADGIEQLIHMRQEVAELKILIPCKLVVT